MTIAPAPPRRGSLFRPLLPHLVWEAVLLLLLLGVVTVAAIRAPMFEGPGPWWSIAVIGLLATGLALSLRTATPNLAVGGIAILTGATYGWLTNEAELPLVVAAVAALLLVLLVGAGLGLVVGLTTAPAWAVSLGGLALAYAAVAGMTQSQAVRVEPLLSGSGVWVALFVVATLAGGAVWAFVPGVRDWLSANRIREDPARFRSDRLIGALVGLTGSSLFGGLAGLAMVSQYRALLLDLSIYTLLLALAAVLIGGVSAAGGRGGVAGTLLGTCLVAVLVHWLILENLRDVGQVVRYALIGVLILAGLGVGRGLAAVGAMLSSGRVPRPGPLPPPPMAPPPTLASPPAAPPPGAAPTDRPG